MTEEIIIIIIFYLIKQNLVIAYDYLYNSSICYLEFQYDVKLQDEEPIIMD